MKPVDVKITDIYVPAGRRKEIDADRVAELAETILDDDDLLPIQVRPDKDRYVLIKGVNRLEARKSLGDETVQVFVVQARQH